MPFGNGRRSDVKGRAPARLQRSKDWNDPLLAPQRSGPPPLRFSQTAGNLTHPSQAAKQPTSDATDQRSSSLRRCRLRRRGGEAERQSSVDVDVDVLGLPVRVRSWDSFGHGTSDAVVDFLFPPGHAMQAAATRRRMQSR